MKAFRINGLRFDFSEAIEARRFAGQEHGMLHCMKAVDFIVELQDKILYLLVADPQQIKEAYRKQELGAYDFITDLTYTFRDSFLYEWASGRTNKPIVCIVLIDIDNLSEPAMLGLSEMLRRKLPLFGIADQWKNTIFNGCNVLNVKTWNRLLPNYPLTRTTQ